MSDLDSSVVEFVAEFTGASSALLSPASTLFGDLGVDGNDGRELIASFGKRFHVDLSSFHPERHFGPDGLSLCTPFLWFWWLVRFPFIPRQSPEERVGLSPIRIGDLSLAARERKWTL